MGSSQSNSLDVFHHEYCMAHRINLYTTAVPYTIVTGGGGLYLVFEMNKLSSKDFVGNALADPKKLFFDKTVALLAYTCMGFIVLDSFINVLPYGNGIVSCFLIPTSGASSFTVGQQAYINDYCSDQVPTWTSFLPFGVFGQGLLTLLLHHSWYSAMDYLARANKTAADGTTKNDAPTYWLFVLYLIKNIFQMAFSIVVPICLYVYEYLSGKRLQKLFDCRIEVPQLESYWTSNASIPCSFNSVAINGVFLNFYGIMMLCVVVAAFIGILDFWIRPDLKDNKCTILPPTDKNIIEKFEEKQPGKEVPAPS